MRYFTKARSAYLWVALLPTLGTAQTPALTPVSKCDKPLKAQYTITEVTVESPFDYLHSIRNTMQDALDEAQVKRGAKYRSALVTAGQNAIRNRLRQQADELALPFTVNVV